MKPQNRVQEDLKSLLSQWKLECILSHLIAEKIDTEILKIMKIHHIRLLLQNYPLGIQIRFEYNMELWRQEIGKPIQTSISEDILQFISKKLGIKANELENKSTQTDLIIYNYSSILNPNTEKNKVPSSTEERSLYVAPNKSHTDFSSTSMSTPQPIQQVNLLTILKYAKYGQELINNYRLRKSFSNSERKLLIGIIANYYLENNMEFNVQISYALERAILKLFPNEKLCFYRTSKRGRLYMRYLRSKAAIKKRNEHFNKVSAQCSRTVNDEELMELCPILEDNQIINPSKNGAESMSSGITDIVKEEETVVAMCYNKLMDDCVIKSEDFNQSTDIKTEIKIEPEDFDFRASLGSVALTSKTQCEETDEQFKNFCIPWHKVPYDVIFCLENQHPLGKSLNTLANIIVDELRKFSTHIPMRVLRAVSEQAVVKYPHSILIKDSVGNVKSSLLSIMRNRNTFLNR